MWSPHPCEASLRVAGFAGSLRAITEWATRQRRADALGAPSRCPAPRALARLLATARNKRARVEAVIVATAQGAVPDLVAAHGVADARHALVRGRDAAGLDVCIAIARASPPQNENAARGLNNCTENATGPASHASPQKQALEIEGGLDVEPAAPLAQDVRAVLRDRKAIFCVIPGRGKSRDRVELDEATPRAISGTHSSTSV